MSFSNEASCNTQDRAGPSHEAELVKESIVCLVCGWHIKVLVDRAGFSRHAAVLRNTRNLLTGKARKDCCIPETNHGHGARTSCPQWCLNGHHMLSQQVEYMTWTHSPAQPVQKKSGRQKTRVKIKAGLQIRLSLNNQTHQKPAHLPRRTNMTSYATDEHGGP